MRVLLNGGPLSGAIVEDVKAYRLMIPVANPEDAKAFALDNIATMPDPRWANRTITYVRDSADDPWRERVLFNQATYRLTDRVTPEGLCVMDYEPARSSSSFASPSPSPAERRLKGGARP